MRLRASTEHNNTPSARFKVALEKVIEGPHVLLLGEEHMVGNVLHDLAHESQASLHVGCRLLFYDA